MADGARMDWAWSALSWALGWVVPKDRTLLAIGGRQFGGNTRPVLERCAELGFRGVWVTRRTEILALGRDDVVDARSIRGAWLMARAGGVLFTHTLGDFSPLQSPGRRARYYNLYHAMPLKRVSTQDPRFAARSYARSDLREMRRYTAMFATSETMRQIFSDTFGIAPADVQLTGQPRTDCLFQGPTINLDARYGGSLPPHRRRVLYCPTYREFEPARLFPFDDRDDDAMQAFLADHDAVMFVRTHPNDPAKLLEPRGRMVPMQGDVVDEVNDVLTQMDVLVTDYSSIYYDFLLLDRPCVFLPYDLEQYQVSPGFYLPFSEVAAGPKPRSQARFRAALARAFDEPEADALARNRVRERVFDFVDGRATERVLAFVAEDMRRA